MPHLFIHNNTCYNRCYIFVYIPFFNAFSIAFSSQYPIIPWLIAPQVSNGIAGVFSVSAAFAVIKYSPLVGHFHAQLLYPHHFPLFSQVVLPFFQRFLLRSRSSFSRLYRISPSATTIFFVPYSSPPVDFAFTALYKVILPVINP